MSTSILPTSLVSGLILGFTSFVSAPWALSQDRSPSIAKVQRYEYESKPADEEFVKFFPAKALATRELILKRGDRLAIVGDSITEQKMYSRIIENYLTACVPHLEISVRQYGWSGEKTDGFLNRMELDCLTFEPTVATLCYGMNDARYRPFDVTNGRWYEDQLRSIVRRFKAVNARVVIGSPGCAGKLATWVKGKSGTLDEHNLNLCALRDIALGVAEAEKVPFADVFWPMYQQQILAPKRFGKTSDEYAVAGKDGIHPGWAGQAIMAYAFLTAMGLDGDLGTIHYDLESGDAKFTGKHTLQRKEANVLHLVSQQYPYCATGALDDDNSLRSGMSLVPFDDKLNRLTLRVTGTNGKGGKVTWGTETKSFTEAQLATGINLAKEFPTNPFSSAFAGVDAAVLKKQTFETHQVKKVFHSDARKTGFAQLVEETEKERAPLAKAVSQSVIPIEHSLRIDLD